jgi:hypothetical protein
MSEPKPTHAAVKAATGIEVANCQTCHYLGSESDGAEYSTGWPSCGKVDRYQWLKSFPFKKEMRCWEPSFWHSKFAEHFDGNAYPDDPATDAFWTTVELAKRGKTKENE